MDNSSWVTKEIFPPNTGLVFAAMTELRTTLGSIEDFVEQVDMVQRPFGYVIGLWLFYPPIETKLLLQLVLGLVLV